ncbi:unnamed protein product, partial [marine sediment metagenome]
IRYGIILVLGLLVILIDHGQFITSKGTIIWDVLPTLGLVGLMTIPFLWLKPKDKQILKLQEKKC